MLSKSTCGKTFVHELDPVCEHVMSGHMIEHVQLLVKKSKTSKFLFYFAGIIVQ